MKKSKNVSKISYRMEVLKVKKEKLRLFVYFVTRILSEMEITRSWLEQYERKS